MEAYRQRHVKVRRLKNLKQLLLTACLLAVLMSSRDSLVAQSSSNILRSTELRADKRSSAPVIAEIPANSTLKILSIEGGWVWVRYGESVGWVRASALDLRLHSADLNQIDSGRQGQANSALVLGVRDFKQRASRHALIITVSKYADARISPLPGAAVDRETATQMAIAMQVPRANIHYLHDEQATGASIRAALTRLASEAKEGDRVFVHFSGHGTRYKDPQAEGCVEALVAHDGWQGGIITNRELAGLMEGLTRKTDKLFVMYDACHSGGLAKFVASRTLPGSNTEPNEGRLRAKFVPSTQECTQVANIKSREFSAEIQAKGGSGNDVIHLSASRDNEVSFDDEKSGGLATQFTRDCMLRDAKDLDGSGAITIDEIRQCAQQKVAFRLRGSDGLSPPTMTLAGNAGFVPAWFSLPPQAPSLAPIVASPGKPVVTPNAPPVGLPTLSSPGANSPPASPESALRQIYEQRNDKHRVQVRSSREQLKIGVDEFDLAIQSNRSGYLYIAMLGSDKSSIYLLFPNDLDAQNRIEAEQQLLLPRPSWRLKAAGPEGSNSLLVMVSDRPRDLSALTAAKAGPFLKSLNDGEGRARLGTLLGSSNEVGNFGCTSKLQDRNVTVAPCSDSFGAAMISIVEKK
jgi:Caspase domain/Domain of unknown function (DUF4384)